MIANFILMTAETEMTTAGYLICLAGALTIVGLAFAFYPMIIKNSTKR